MGCYYDSHEFKWIGCPSPKFSFPDPGTGSEWPVLNTLSERDCGEPDENDKGSRWAQAVYTCRNLNGISPDAVLKVYVQ